MLLYCLCFEYHLERCPTIVKVSTGIMFDELRVALEKNIQTACLWLGLFPLVCVWGAEDVQKVLTSTATNEKADEYKYFKFALGNGLLTAPNNIWRITRSNANPVFHPRNVEQLTPFFNQNCRELIKILSHHVDRAPFDVYEYTMKIALKSVSHLIYGPELVIDINSQVFNRLLHMIERVPQMIMERVRKPWLWSDSIFNYFHRQDLEEFNNVFNIFIDDTMKESKTETFIRHPKEKINAEGTGIFTLLEAFRTMQTEFPGFTDTYLREEILTIYGTGTETIGLTVASCLVALGQYPDIQDKLYDEIELVVEQEEITLNDIRKMQYLDQVYYEVLRITTTVPLVARKCTEDLKLSECTVPAGNTVVVVLAGLHMNPKFYPNPKSFDPERFSPENCIGREKNSFLPFSGGPRSCIGKSYAQLLVKLMVVHILRQYRISTDMDIHNMRQQLVITLVSTEGYNIKLQKRH